MSSRELSCRTPISRELGYHCKIQERTVTGYTCKDCIHPEKNLEGKSRTKYHYRLVITRPNGTQDHIRCRAYKLSDQGVVFVSDAIQGVDKEYMQMVLSPHCYAMIGIEPITPEAKEVRQT
ncbi:hypothetical protein D4R42_04530 [bacterium]|nr:MAG: hypothetical protein D4R42_04530 [bacterium]